jgi:hypothetical protein
VRRTLGASCSKRRRSFLAFLILPIVLLADGISTFVGLKFTIWVIEANWRIVSLYNVGLWAVAAFHSLTIVTSLGYALLMYFLAVRSKLPLWSRRMCAASYFTSACLLSSIPIHNISIITGHFLLGGADAFIKYDQLFSTVIPICLALALTLSFDYLALKLS